MEAVAIKIQIDQSMVGKPAYILTDPDKYQVSEWGEYIAVKFNPGIDQRSLEQNNLYFACLNLLVENKQDIFIIRKDKEGNEIKDYIWKTKERAHKQVRWACGYIDRDSAIHFVDKDGNSRLYFELDSVSFSKSRQKKVNAYYDDAFKFMSDDLGITVDDLIAEAQSRMKARRICRICGTTQKIQGHHKLSQTQLYRELYPEFIDHPDNKIDYCIDCHDNKSIEKWTETEFCKHFGIEPRSKSGQGAA